jgi:hypothetical protein
MEGWNDDILYRSAWAENIGRALPQMRGEALVKGVAGRRGVEVGVGVRRFLVNPFLE